MTPSALNANSITTREQMTLLCQSFHVLRGRPGVEPWEQLAFAKWASGGVTAAERQAAAFVLSVWNGSCLYYDGRKASLKTWWNQGDYRVGIFDMVHAFAVWDESMKAAFLAWCADPFYP